MRINLNVPFAENPQAKALGARWDQANKTWYVVDPQDLGPFMRWLGEKLKKPARELTQQQLNALAQKRGGGASKHKRRRHGHKSHGAMSAPIVVPATDDSLIDCGCTHVAPWEDCEHTMPGVYGLDADQAEHMRAIAAGC